MLAKQTLREVNMCAYHVPDSQCFTSGRGCQQIIKNIHKQEFRDPLRPLNCSSPVRVEVMFRIYGYEVVQLSAVLMQLTDAKTFEDLL
jgi:hypothetical protein